LSQDWGQPSRLLFGGSLTQSSSSVDLREIARLTQDYSCADLEEVTVEAARKALKEDTYITQKQLKRGVRQGDPSVDPSKW